MNKKHILRYFFSILLGLVLLFTIIAIVNTYQQRPSVDSECTEFVRKNGNRPDISNEGLHAYCVDFGGPNRMTPID